MINSTEVLMIGELLRTQGFMDLSDQTQELAYVFKKGHWIIRFDSYDESLELSNISTKEKELLKDTPSFDTVYLLLTRHNV